MTLIEDVVWKRRFKEYGGINIVDEFLKRDPTFGWPIKVDKNAIYSALVEGGYWGRPSRNPIYRFLHEGDTEAKLLSSKNIGFIMGNLYSSQRLRGIRDIGMHGIPLLIEEIKKLYLPVASKFLSPSADLARNIIAKFRDSVYTISGKHRLPTVYVSAAMFSEILYKSHKEESGVEKAFTYLFKKEGTSDFHMWSTLMWYSEILTSEDILERSKGLLKIKSEKALEDFQEYVKGLIFRYLRENTFPDANNDLLEIAINIKSLLSENSPNKDSVPFSEDGPLGTFATGLQKALRRGSIPLKSSIEKWIKLIESKVSRNKYTDSAINLLKAFNINYHQHLKRSVGTLSHYALEWESIHYLRERLGVDISTYECKVPNPKFPGDLRYATRIDLVIKRNLGGFQNIEDNSFLEIPDAYNEIAIDFTKLSESDTSDTFIWNKLKKGYQSDNRFLLVVIYNIEGGNDVMKIKELNEDIHKKNPNAMVITLDQYLEYIGMKAYIEPGKLTNKYLKKIYEMDDLGRAALDSVSPSQGAYDELLELKDLCRNNLIQIPLPQHIDYLHLLGQRLLPLNPGKKLP